MWFGDEFVTVINGGNVTREYLLCDISVTLPEIAPIFLSRMKSGIPLAFMPLRHPTPIVTIMSHRNLCRRESKSG